MYYLIAAFMRTMALAISLLQFLMFIRAILSWIPTMSDTPITSFIYTVTEWVIMPVRVVFEKLNINVSLPIDIPFFVTFILLSVIESIIL